VPVGSFVEDKRRLRMNRATREPSGPRRGTAHAVSLGMTLHRVLAAVLLACVTTSSADAYVRMRTPDGVQLAWQRGCPAFTVTAGGGPGVSASEIARLIEEARAAWEDGPSGCAALPVEIVAQDDVGGIVYDGANQLLWRPLGHCKLPGTELDEVCLSPNAAAVTTVFYYERGARAGEIVEADMEVNGEFTFGLLDEVDRLDLLSVITHELGHALGFEHTCETIPGRAPMIDSTGARVPYCSPLYLLPESVRLATMFPFLRAGELHARTPLDDERGAVCDLYREHRGACEDTGPGCGCESGAGGATAGVLLVVLSLLRRSRTSLRSRR
jgi:hypothetical protein